jgi:hypothetical protein
MDTAIRPVSPIAEAVPTRPIDPTAGVATDLSAALTVTSASQGQTGSSDSRRQEFKDRAEITTSQVMRKALAFDDATHLPVVRKIKSPNLVVDQIPSEAYLRMRVALQEALDSSQRHSKEVDREA